MEVSEDAVREFIGELVIKVDVFGIIFRNRDKNLQALADLNITSKEREVYIKNLKSKNYIDGPCDDTENPSRRPYYVFGISVNDFEVYVKISLGPENKPVDCISFHKAEYPLKLKFS